jgi:hypothetical protein
MKGRRDSENKAILHPAAHFFTYFRIASNKKICNQKTALAQGGRILFV